MNYRGAIFHDWPQLGPVPYISNCIPGSMGYLRHLYPWLPTNLKLPSWEITTTLTESMKCRQLIWFALTIRSKYESIAV